MKYVEMNSRFFLAMCAAFDDEPMASSDLFDSMYCMGGEL